MGTGSGMWEGPNTVTALLAKLGKEDNKDIEGGRGQNEGWSWAQPGLQRGKSGRVCRLPALGSWRVNRKAGEVGGGRGNG